MFGVWFWQCGHFWHEICPIDILLQCTEKAVTIMNIFWLLCDHRHWSMGHNLSIYIIQFLITVLFWLLFFSFLFWFSEYCTILNKEDIWSPQVILSYCYFHHHHCSFLIFCGHCFASVPHCNTTTPLLRVTVATIQSQIVYQSCVCTLYAYFLCCYIVKKIPMSKKIIKWCNNKQQTMVHKQGLKVSQVCEKSVNTIIIRLKILQRQKRK